MISPGAPACTWLSDTWLVGRLSLQTGIAAQMSVGAGASATEGVPAAIRTTSALALRAWASCQPTQVALSSTAALGGSASDLILNEAGLTLDSLGTTVYHLPNRGRLASYANESGANGNLMLDVPKDLFCGLHHAFAAAVTAMLCVRSRSHGSAASPTGGGGGCGPGGRPQAVRARQHAARPRVPAGAARQSRPPTRTEHRWSRVSKLSGLKT